MTELEMLKKYTSKASRFMMVEDCLLHYRVEGAGQPLLLLHGAFSSLHTFDSWAKKLKQDYQVIRLDLPGFGLSSAFPDKILSIAKFLKLIRRFLQRLELDKVSLVGSSLGGWLSWEFALKYKTQVNNLVLIGAAGFVKTDNIPLPIKMMRTPFVDKIVRYAVRKQTLEVFLKEVFVDTSKVTPKMVDRYFELFTYKDNQASFFRLVNSNFKDRTKRLKEIEHPTLIIWGEQDKWVPVEDAYEFQERIPRAELVIYEDLGHLPFEEAPSSTLKDLKEFLQINGA